MQIDNIKGLILDMDGVLWQGKKEIGNLNAIFERIRNLDLQVILATNNATRSVDAYVEYLASFGVLMAPENVINSAIATTQYLTEKYPHGGPVYVVGEVGLIETLASAGFHNSEEDVLAVISSWDREFSYRKMRIATRCILNGAEFIATNPDKTFPTPQGLVPGAGSILASIQAATGQEPLIMGKPQPLMYQMAISRLNLEPRQVLAVGDRYETDIMGGKNTGCRTALVLSGVTSEEQSKKLSDPPDIVSRDLSSIVKIFEV